jgi:hypothetical protein
MSSIDTRILDYKQIIADLEKQKQDEEEAYRNTIDYNMEQLDKYVENIETKIQQRREGLKNQYGNKPDIKHDQYEFIESTELSKFRRELYNSLVYKYKEDGEEIKIMYDDSYMYRSKPYYYCHIFEFIYKILKHLFTSTKKMSNYYDNVISRLEKLEEQVNLLENENKHLKEKLYDLI